MAEINGSSDFSPVQTSSQDARSLPGAASNKEEMPEVTSSAGVSKGSTTPAQTPSTPTDGPMDTVDIKTPDPVSMAYRIDQKAQQIYVQFVDSKTGIVVTQLPPPQVLAFEDQVAQYLNSRRQAEEAPGGAGKAQDSTSVKEG